MNPEEAIATEILLLEAERQIDELKAIARELLDRLPRQEADERLLQIEKYLW
jgi:hypothetical protein